MRLRAYPWLNRQVCPWLTGLLCMLSFEQRVIYTAPHPNWGSSGIQLVDLDKDGDLDVLLTHGDTFDDGIVKPYHGIQWLENTGAYPFFAEHTLAPKPGVHRAEAADLDGDGDLDIVACAWSASFQSVHRRARGWTCGSIKPRSDDVWIRLLNAIEPAPTESCLLHCMATRQSRRHPASAMNRT